MILSEKKQRAILFIKTTDLITFDFLLYNTRMYCYLNEFYLKKFDKLFFIQILVFTIYS